MCEFCYLYLSHHIGDCDMIGNRAVPRKGLKIPPIQTDIIVSLVCYLVAF
jgi:hypothetical protein